MESKLRLAIVGCGAVIELCYLPALRRLRLAPAMWVDAAPDRARPYAAELGGAVATDAFDALDDFDAAILALPHHLHAPIGVALLDAGKHVLLEKPMATNSAGCRALLAAAAHSGATLGVGHVRRFMPLNRWVKGALEAELLGNLQSVDVREGAVFGWPATSDFFWRRATAGGGVLSDTGAHVLDLLLWWLGQPETVAYRDDAMGGVEAEALAELRIPGHTQVTCELSRTRELRNSVIFQGEAGSLEVGCHSGHVIASPTSLLEQTYDGLRGDRLPKPELAELFAAQVTNFLAAAAGESQLVCLPTEAAAAVALIDACYAVRRTWLLPWVVPTPDPNEVTV